MGEFKVGDRVKTLYGKRIGTVEIVMSDKMAVYVHWDRTAIRKLHFNNTLKLAKEKK